MGLDIPVRREVWRFEKPEEFCGLQQTVSDRETNRGTHYEIAKWTCPNCGRDCSCVYVDDEFVHGDCLCTSFGPEKEADGTWKRHHKCGTCWLDTEKAARTVRAPDGGQP